MALERHKRSEMLSWLAPTLAQGMMGWPRHSTSMPGAIALEHGTACVAESPLQGPADEREDAMLALDEGASAERGGVPGPTFRADIFLAILLIRSVSSQYFSMAAGPLDWMSWKTSLSSGSSFSCIIFSMRSGDCACIFCIAESEGVLKMSWDLPSSGLRKCDCIRIAQRLPRNRGRTYL